MTKLMKHRTTVFINILTINIKPSKIHSRFILSNTKTISSYIGPTTTVTLPFKSYSYISSPRSNKLKSDIRILFPLLGKFLYPSFLCIGSIHEFHRKRTSWFVELCTHQRKMGWINNIGFRNVPHVL